VTDTTPTSVPPPEAEPTTTAAPARKGRPVLAAVCGFLLGLFIALDLLVFGVIPLNSIVITLLPLIGLVLGIALTKFRR
jgi:hypothetical protein